jgi:YegS/Rv2252/BmrU family lipid kinase
MADALLIYNPVAGRNPSRLLTERAAAVLQEYGWHITRLAQQAADEGKDALFVVGGDGTINRAVRGLVGTSTALGVLPAGTANVWAQELRLPGLSWTRIMALEESARRYMHTEVRAIDIGLCNAEPFLLWAGVGLDGFIVHRIEPRSPLEKRFATVYYLASAMVNASQWRGMNLEVMTDGERIRGHFLLAVVSNVRLYAGGFAELSPHALMDDGLMDLWLFEGDNLENILQIAWDLWSGRHLNSERVMRIPFQAITMESDSRLYMQVDGEPGEAEDAVNIQVLPRALRILVPAQAPHHLFSSPPIAP